jgi:hypothetical protein
MASAQIRSSVKIQLAGLNAFGGAFWNNEVISALDLADGNGAGQINQIYAAQPTIASGANLDLDLIGTLLQPTGQAFVPTQLVQLIMINAPIDPNATANTTNITVGAGTNPVVGLFGTTSGAIGPGGTLNLYRGAAGGLCTVTAATADILRFANSAGATATIQIILLGRA